MMYPKHRLHYCCYGLSLTWIWDCRGLFLQRKQKSRIKREKKIPAHSSNRMKKLTNVLTWLRLSEQCRLYSLTDALVASAFIRYLLSPSNPSHTRLTRKKSTILKENQLWVRIFFSAALMRRNELTRSGFGERQSKDIGITRTSLQHFHLICHLRSNWNYAGTWDQSSNDIIINHLPTMWMKREIDFIIMRAVCPWLSFMLI